MTVAPLTDNPLFLAVDTTDMRHARELIAACAPHIGGVKLGLEFFCRHGPRGIATLLPDHMPLFLDLKLHDIPNTVWGAMRALHHLEPAVVTVHAAGGAAMLRAARDAALPQTKVIAVTVLTSMDDADLGAVGVADGPAAQVARLAALTRDAGVDGIVCSGAEVAAARDAWPGGLFVVPGIRPGGALEADQKRVMTPGAALAAGARVLVVGRPITEAPDPAAAARAIAGTLHA